MLKLRKNIIDSFIFANLNEYLFHNKQICLGKRTALFARRGFYMYRYLEDLIGKQSKYLQQQKNTENTQYINISKKFQKLFGNTNKLAWSEMTNSYLSFQS